MKALWSRLMSRVDALSLRERVLMFAGAIAILALLTDTFFVTPLTQQQKKLSQSIDQQSEDSESRHDQLLADLKKRDRERVVTITSDLSRLQGDIEAVDREIATMGASPVDATALPVLLDRVLKKTDKVAVVKVVSFKAEPPATPTSPPMRAALDITLSGGYLDLMDYLVNLEKSLPSVRWSAVRVNAASAPTQVTVRMLLPEAP